MLTYILQNAVQRRTAEERRAAIEQEIETRWSPEAASRRRERPEVSSLLIQLVMHGAPKERRAGLLALVQVAPRLLVELSPVLLAMAETDEARAFVRDVTLQASNRDIDNMFYDELRFVREFLKRDLHERACAEYPNAWNLLPLRVDLNGERFEQGSALCESGRFQEGTLRMQEAFSKVVIPR
jgi:hypothetical protein